MLYLGTASNTCVQMTDNGYQIYDDNGNRVGPEWTQMGPYQNGLYYQVLTDEGIGMMAADGTLVLYGDCFGFVSPGAGWVIGIIME